MNESTLSKEISIFYSYLMAALEVSFNNKN